jgi:phosphoribosyl 1,2-cyclic phosphodiesterase
MSLFVRFWGTRGSIPTPGPRTQKYGGNTACVEVRVNDTLIICDAGSGIRELGMDLLKRGKKPVVGHMFFSHAHWDHIQGFPFFIPVYVPTNTFHVYGTRQGDTRIHGLLSGQMRSDYFPVDFSELKSKIQPRGLDNGQGDIDGVRVRTFEQKHPGGSVAYSFEAEGRRVVYATDNEIDLTLPDREESLRDPAKVRSIPADLLDFMRGADLVIADGQYTDQEYATKVGWGHPRVSTIVDMAVLARVKQLAVSHHDPMHADADVDAMVAAGRERAAGQGSDVVVFGAREGMELKLA